MTNINKKINFSEQLKNFREKYIEETGNLVFSDQTTGLINIFNTTLSKINREQNKVDYKLDELISVVEEAQEKIEEVQEREEQSDQIRKMIGQEQKDKDCILKVLLDIMDQVEIVHNYSKKDTSNEWNNQICIVWQTMSKILLSAGITRIDDDGTPYNPFLNTVHSTASDEDKENNIILDVIQCGYLYKGDVLRKSQVIVNKIAKDKINDIEFQKIATNDENDIEMLESKINENEGWDGL